MRPTARNTPVTIAGNDAGSTTRKVVCMRFAPRAKLACRSVSGTSFMLSSAERTTMGIIITARANAPANPLKPSGRAEPVRNS